MSKVTDPEPGPLDSCGPDIAEREALTDLLEALAQPDEAGSLVRGNHPEVNQ